EPDLRDAHPRRGPGQVGDRPQAEHEPRIRRNREPPLLRAPDLDALRRRQVLPDPAGERSEGAVALARGPSPLDGTKGFPLLSAHFFQPHRSPCRGAPPNFGRRSQLAAPSRVPPGARTVMSFRRLLVAMATVVPLSFAATAHAQSAKLGYVNFQKA